MTEARPAQPWTWPGDDAAAAVPQPWTFPADAQADGAVDEGDVLRRVRDELSDAEAYTDTLIGEERAKALDYYLRRPIGDERIGRSRVVSGEVYKVVEGVSTAIASIFVGAKNAIEFVPRRPEDVQAAEQRTATVNYVFGVQNHGFLAMLEAIKDGVLSKTGYLTWRWEPDLRVTMEHYREQTPESLQLLLADNAAVQIVEQSAKPGAPGPDGRPQALIDATVRVVKSAGRAVVESVPPEEVKVSPRARSMDMQKAPSVHWVTRKSREDLLRCGYAEDVIDRLAFSATALTGDQPVVRKVDDSSERTGEGEAEIIVTWLTADMDGDGVPELRRIVWSDAVLIENAITDEIEMSAWSPNVQPHEFIGRCPADDAVESQETMTAIKRQMLDNLYIANNPMWRLDTSDARVNVEDFYSPEIGRPLRAPPGSADIVTMPFVAQHAFPMLEYEQADAENKTGFTRYSQGLDAKSLNQTARGISIVTNMSQQRVMLMARIFGEMCLKPCLRGIAKLLSQHSEKALAFRLNGKFVNVDPREWTEEFDMEVTVGLGVADKDQQLMHLTTIAQAQAQAAQGGLMGQIVTPQNIYAVQARIAENAGFRDASFAWTDPSTVPPPQPQPNPEQIKAQAEQQQLQMKLQAEAVTKERVAMIEAQTAVQVEQMRAPYPFPQ